MEQLFSSTEPVGSALASNGFAWRQVPFTREGWDSEFPDGTVTTSLGVTLPVSPEMVDSHFQDGVSLFGLIRPTLENPSYVTTDPITRFHRPVLTPEGEVRGYVTVSVAAGHLSVSVSDVSPYFLSIVDGLSADAVVDAELNDDGNAIFKSLSTEAVDGLGAYITDFSLASAIKNWGVEFFKSEHGPIPDGARWITVHPNGDGSKGVPILVQPAKDNSGTFHVIGGAGGKLNYLKLRGVKSEAEYRQDAQERANQKKAKRKEQILADKEAGIHEAKVAARQEINQQRLAARDEFISAVAEAMGWGDDELKFNDDGLTPEAAKKGEADHKRMLFNRAKAAVEMQRQVLVADADTRAAVGLGEVPFSVNDDTELSVEDLDPVRVSESSGISQDFKARAEAAGLSQDKLDAEVATVKEAENSANLDTGSGENVKNVEKGELAAKIRAELALVPKPDLAAKVVEANKAVALLKARKKLQALERAARDANKEVDASTVEPKAYVLTATDVDTDAVMADVEDELRTISTKAFLSEVDKAGGDDALGQHVASGAYNAINSLSQAAGGASLLDRSVVDVLGVAGAAQVLARRLHSDFGDDAQKITAALEEFHVAHYTDLAEQSVAQAKELQDAAAELEDAEVTSAPDLIAASELLRQKKQYLADSRKVLGQALGEMEANASMVMAMREGKRDFVQVSLGPATLDSAIKQLWAIGLKDGDYQIDRVAGNVFVTVHASGMDKLASGVDVENSKRVSRNLAIMRGEDDEDDWLPQGFANRPDLALNLKAGVATTLAQPFDHAGADLSASLRDYVGGRTADGDRAADILADIQSADFYQRVGAARAEEYRKALDAVAPTKGEDGKMVRAEDLAPKFDGYADDFVASKWGGERSTLNKQQLEPDAIAQDSLHRALAAEPAGTVAFKPVGELTRKDVGAIRDWFYKNVAHESPELAGLRESANSLASNEPERYTTDMFGDSSENPEWSEWRSQMDDYAAKIKASGLDWAGYCKQMRGSVRAMESVQDLIRSRVSEHFAKHYNTLRPDAPLKTGRAVVRNNLNHLSAVDPAAHEARLSMERSLIDTLRERVAGKYASGSVADKIDAQKEQKAAFDQAQMGFFSSEEQSDTVVKPMGADERHTIGHAAESMLAKMMGPVGKNFQPGKPVKLFQPTMSGPDGVKRQRAIKLVQQNKRVILGAGVGSGKTAIGLGAFSHLHEQGLAKKGVFVVPSIVQGQFGAEALRFLEPGKFNWHCQPGGSFEDRLKSYKDPDTHFTVVTHQSFRDDVLRMAAAHEGIEPEAVADKLGTMTAPERAAYVKSVLDKEGIAWDYAMADEAHGLLNREGKENSRMSNVIEGVTDNVTHYVHASGDPVKNDASEAFSLLQKMDSARYSDRDAFMRRYGGDTKAAKDGLQRELARHLYAMSINPDVQVTRTESKVAQSAGQTEALNAIEKNTAALRIAKMSGTVNLAAAKAIAPHMFEGVPEDQHEAVAKEVAESAPLLKETAIKRVLNNHPAAGKLDDVVAKANERKGKQGVVFAHSLAAVEAIRKRLEAEGHRVATITGKDSAQSKGEKIQQFNPDAGEATADIIVCSDAGATGANLQSGKWLYQYDTPDTAMTHAQRQGRINRIGQKNQIELIDAVADHESERRSRRRLATKYGLRELMTSPLDALDDTGLAHYLHQKGFGATKTQPEMF